MIELVSNNEEETRKIGADIAMAIEPGDLLGLSGDLGAGKTGLARAIIQHLAQNPSLEVASPSYTICNFYDLDIPISHYDLYRLGSIDEMDELDLDEALDVGCALVEWPERCFETLPDCSVHLRISTEVEDLRTFTLEGNADFLERLERSFAIRGFLDHCNFDDALREPLSADASARRYEMVWPAGKDGERWFLMDSPQMPDGPPVKCGKPYSQIAHLAENISAFVAIGNLLREKGFAAPTIPAFDLADGFALIEHLGNDLVITPERLPIAERYLASIEFLASLHSNPIDHHCLLPDGSSYAIPGYDRDAMIIEVELLSDWYVPLATGDVLSEQSKEDFREIWTSLVQLLENQPRTLVLRDFHSPNIIWRGEKSDTDRIGLIDFQDAVIGPSAYDVASLAQDARIDISRELESQLLQHYLSCSEKTDAEFDRETFEVGYRIMAAQRATKVLGIFVRLKERDGKEQYLKHLPRIQDYLSRSLVHPVLADYRSWLESSNVMKL